MVRPIDAITGRVSALLGRYTVKTLTSSLRIASLGQFAIGVQFNTTIHERDIEARVTEAVIRLRWVPRTSTSAVGEECGWVHALHMRYVTMHIPSA